MIKILVGRQTDSLQEKILQQAVENYQHFPEHETFIIVPNHIKFTTEIRAINKLAVSQNQVEQSVEKLRVLSFSRLAWFFLKDEEKGLPIQLDDAAAAMLLAKIIEQNRDHLHLFQKANINPGLIKQLYDTILQIRSGNLDLDDIDENQLNLETKEKISDLKIIYHAFIDEISEKFLTANEIQLQLNEYLASDSDLSKADFYFSDFSHFSLQECITIKLLMQKVHSVTLAFKTQKGTIVPNCVPGEYDYVVQKTINQLIGYLKQQNLQYIIDQTPAAINPTNREMLNQFWTGMVDNIGDVKSLQLVKADNRYAEAYFVARTIYQQVALNKYRYRDFLVLAPNLHEYETYLIPILRQNNIPFFDDLQQEMKFHPLVVLIENIAQLVQRPLATTNMLAIMKTRLIIPEWYQEDADYLHDVDKLENFVLAHGINHNLWQRNFTSYVAASVIRLDQVPDEVVKINKLKDFFVKEISKLITRLKKERDTRKAITIFFDFLTKNGVPKVLENWRATAQECGDLQQARQSEQVWNLLNTLLEDYLLINPEEFSVTSFFNVLVNGFKEANFAQIPATMDAVNLSETGIVQISGYKQVFILGATNNNLPQINNTPGFLSSENLENMSKTFGEDSYLEDQQKLSNLDQNYQFGLCLALAQDRVYLSYPVTNTENESIEPSIYYQRFKRAGISEFLQHDLPLSQQEILSFITNPKASLGYLTYLKQTQAEIDVDVNYLLKLTQKRLPNRTKLVLDSCQFINEPVNLGPELAQKLYGENLSSSVSQLETYFENSYEFFLQYGLRLHKRFENELDVIQAGNYCHETLDRLVKELNKHSFDLAEINDDDLSQLLEQVHNKMKSEAQYQQLYHDPFNQFLFDCLDQTTTKVVNYWHRAVQKTPLKAKYSELSFGLGEPVAGLNFKIPNLDGQHYINLRGKIDRVDLAAIPEKNEILAQVIDYKSSSKRFNMGYFYEGISLQMISYLDILAHNQQFFAGKQPLALLGAFYETFTRQLDRLNDKNSFKPNLQPKQANFYGKKKLKYSGLINFDQMSLFVAEPELDIPSTTSNLYDNVRTKADGTLSSRKDSPIFTEDELEQLLQYDEELIKEASSQILSGQIKLNPYRYGKSINALTYSDYRDIFFFDAMLKENKYHQIDNLTKQELITKIKNKLSLGDKEKNE